MCRVCGGVSSFVDVPRITFAGLYRADIPTANNKFSDFAFAAGYGGKFSPRWNPQGGGGFSLINCTVRSITYANGSTSQSDTIMGSRVVMNHGLAEAKLIDIDYAPIFHSDVFGMTLAVLNEASDAPAIIGSSPPFPPQQDVWSSVSCPPSSSNLGRDSSHSATVLQNVKWSIGGSEILRQMHMQAGGRDLSVGLTLYNHCSFGISSMGPQLTPCENTGYLVGTIGVIQSGSDPAAFSSFEGARIMTFDGVQQVEIAWPPEDPCSDPEKAQGQLWMHKAPFIIDEINKAVRVVFSNAFSKNNDGLTLRDFGSDLSLAILNEKLSCVHVLANGNIPYRQPEWLESRAAIFDAPLTDDEVREVDSTPLVVTRLVLPGEGKSVTEYPPCGGYNGTHPRYQLMLRESPYYVRPRGNYAHRMEAGDTTVMSVYVTHFGRPSANTSVILGLFSPQEGTPFSDGIAPLQMEEVTDKEGFAHFTFVAKSYKRLTYCGYDRLAYKFVYKLKADNNACFLDIDNTCINPLVFCLWRDDSETFKPPYSWQEHVGPIFKQYDILYPVMRTILNLSNFTDVIQPRNIRLIRHAMTLDFNHPSYMPVTRDLSPIKQTAILEWLDDPLYESPISILSSDIIALCNSPIFFHSANRDTAICSSNAFALHPHFAECAHFDWESSNPSALAEWQKDTLQGSCTLGGLRRQLQQAIELEFATIPLYLTALYSIKDGYNVEVYGILQTVVLQEMLHLAQAANLLIAAGGHPQIDSEAAAPHYPSKGLPGNVLPNLNVTLQRASREHIYEVFMTLEHPHHFDVANSTTHSSVGDFYDQILRCMEYLHSKRKLSFKKARTKSQIQWPWKENDYGNLYVVKNLDDARLAIAAIREQGEGSTPIDPTHSGSDELGHFFLFEQIVCGRKLVYDQPSNRHSFTGAPVEFDPEGVWPIRNNPSREGLTPGTQAYTIALIFHQQYRSLLRQIQAAFDGNPEGIRDTVATMMALTVYGKRAAAERMDPDVCDSETVGPVWDYEWQE